MEELLRVSKKQLQFQKIIAGCLVIIAVVFAVVGFSFVNQMSRMTASLEAATEKLQEINVDGINDSISAMGNLLESVGDFSEAVDGITQKVEEFDSWMSGLGLLGGGLR